jgi:cell division protein FtsQ
VDGGGRFVFALSGKGASDDVAAGSGLVLPRPLRRVVRLMRAPALDALTFPRHAGSLAAAAFLGCVGLYGMVLGGHTTQVVGVGTVAVGLAVEDVVITGNVETSEIDILQLIGLDGGTSLVALDVATARDALMELPWVQQVDVRKVYPRGLEIDLTERQAFGIWQNGSELSLIERDGNGIGPMTRSKFASLPLYVGLGADKEAAELDRLMNRWPEFKTKVRAYVRVADRRWDLRLDNGVTVRLPEEAPGEALAQLKELDDTQQVLARDIAAIDLRLADRVTIQLTAEALERRQAALAAREKAAKAAGQRT